MQREYLKAIGLYTKILEKTTEITDIYLYRGTTYFTIGEFELAKFDFERQISLSENNQAKFTYAKLLIYSDDYYSAIGLLNNLTLHEEFKYNSSVYLSILNYMNSQIGDAIKNLEFISNFDLNINDRPLKAYANLIHKLINWRHRNEQFKMYSTNSSRVINVIGDSHSLSTNGLLIDINNLKFICRTKLVVGIQMHHLASEFPNKYKSSIENIINNTPHNSVICISVGEIDTRFDYGFLPHMKDLKEVGENIKKIVNDFIKFINNICSNNYSIIFIGVSSPNANSMSSNEYLNETRKKIIFQINEALKSTATKLGFGFLDLYNLTRNSDGYSHSEMSLDSIHLNPKTYSVAFNNHLILPFNFKINH
jgi:hypothetical protein